MSVFSAWNDGKITNTSYFLYPGGGTIAAWRLDPAHAVQPNDLMDTLEAVFNLSARTLKDCARINPNTAGTSLTTGTSGAGLWYDGNVTAKRGFLGMEAGSDTMWRLYSGPTLLNANVFKIDLSSGQVYIPNAATYANDTAAGAGGLTAGAVYQDSTGILRRKL